MVSARSGKEKRISGWLSSTKACCGLYRAAGLSNHQRAVKQDVARGQVRAIDAVEHGCERGFPDGAARLADGGERNRQQTGIAHVIDADDADILRNANIPGEKHM